MGWQDPAAIPYCGLPPSLEALGFTWNRAPSLIGILAAEALVYAVGLARLVEQPERSIGDRQIAAFYTD